jgi:RHS repeat-associated protein
VNYTYDNDSRLIQVSDPTGTYQFTFDNMGRLTQATTQYTFLTGRNFTAGYSYDAASNRTGFTDPENGATSYVYDTLNRLQTLTPPAAFSGTGNFGFSYDALSRRTQMTRPNGLKSVYAYDNLSRLLSVLHQSGATTLDGASYTVDNAGNRATKTDQLAGVTSNYTYDPLYELTQVTQGVNTTESYSYDQVGNRLSSLGVSPYNYNASNELTSIPGTTYTYDYNGNTLTSTTGSNTTSYTWDFENRLSSVTLPGSGGTVTFKYDPFGRRIDKSSSSGTSIYAYDGNNLVEDTNSLGSVIIRYARTQNIDEPLAMLRSGTTSFYHGDGLGSITSLSNASGSIAQTYTFDSFGKQTASSGPLTNPFQYTARESDTETGLYYYRARYYDKGTRRFLSEDPIRLKGGINFYRYARNNPLSLSDPTGLTTYKGFPADEKVKMELAVQAVPDKVNSTCPSFADIDKARILAYLDRANFVYNPKSDVCGNSDAFKWFSNTIEIGEIAFGPECRCLNGPSSNSLPSLLLHEVFHLIYFFPREDAAYALEKKCFGCDDPRKQ